MAWQDFLKKEETVALPWIGGSKITDGTRWFTLSKFPREHGWYNFRINGRKAEYINVAEPNNDCLKSCKSGYLIGNLILQDTAPSYIEPSKIFKFAEKVHFVPSSIDKFVRVKVGKVDESSEYIYISEDFPLGPEELVLSAYLDNLPIDNISGLPSSLVATYNYEVWYRNELERRRLDAIRRAEEAERERAERERKERLFNQLGTGSGRREMADVSANVLLKALAQRHKDDVFVPECKNGPTQTGSHRRLDAWVMLKTWSPVTMIGYEIKVSRSDCRRTFRR
jgi:hypothetical protein